jgi:predicted nucleic-acid-binding protein
VIGLDTNVIARYVLNDDDAQFAAAQALFASLSVTRPGFITQVALVELYWIMRQRYKVPRGACLAAIYKLVEMRQLEFEDAESVVRALALAEDGADFADALIAVSGELFGVTETVTFDRAAATRLGWRALSN